MKTLTDYIKESYIPFAKRCSAEEQEHIADFISKYKLSPLARRDMLAVLDVMAVSKKEWGIYPEKITLEATPQANWRVYFDGKDTGTTINGNLISSESIDELEWRHFNDEEE